MVGLALFNGFVKLTSLGKNQPYSYNAVWAEPVYPTKTLITSYPVKVRNHPNPSKKIMRL
jgi:hypothetical protein